MGGFFFDFGAIRTASSDRDAPAQALQTAEVDVGRAHFVGSPEEGQEEAQGPEAVGDLGVSRSKCRARAASSSTASGECACTILAASRRVAA